MGVTADSIVRGPSVDPATLVGSNPLVVIGMNPSPAADQMSDSTVNRVVESEHGATPHDLVDAEPRSQAKLEAREHVIMVIATNYPSIESPMDDR
ncbi:MULTISPECIES: hypothetical protein [Microbacterium]|uniref:hypothetical protein n=1 Tax=Microbacterium TaxID=33882 RepID=UPI0019CF7FC0|nr:MULTISPECIES: hypothetical protein [Microbacterium]MCE7483699.1 DUF1643 domain-containing protein [Microbacterium profundi]